MNCNVRIKFYIRTILIVVFLLLGSMSLVVSNALFPSSLRYVQSNYFFGSAGGQAYTANFNLVYTGMGSPAASAGDNRPGFTQSGPISYVAEGYHVASKFGKTAIYDLYPGNTYSAPQDTLIDFKLAGGKRWVTQYNPGLVLDGTGDYLEVGTVDPGILNPTSAITVEAWVKSASAGGYSGSQQIISKFDAYALGSLTASDNDMGFSIHRAEGAWEDVGSSSFSNLAARNISLQINNNRPMVAFTDIAHMSKATVMSYNGTDWVAEGSTGFSDSYAYYIDLDYPYVAYSDGSLNNAVTVMEFNGVDWELKGSKGFSPGGAESLTIREAPVALYAYVAFIDAANDYKASVMGYDGASWGPIGGYGFSAGQVSDLTMEIDSTGNIYVAFRDNTLGGKATVMKFDASSLGSIFSSSWETVGSAGFSTSAAFYTKIALDSSGVPYVAFADNSNGTRTTVMKFNGTSWDIVGSAGFSASFSEAVVLSMHNDVPYVAYKDYGNSLGATTMKFNGTSWENVGSVDISGGQASYISLDIDSAGKPYVAYSDYSDGEKGFVKSYEAWEDVSYSVSTPGDWHHFVGAYDSSASSLKLYVDGVLRSTSNVSGEISFDAGTIFVGKNESGVGDDFHGWVDGIRIYNRAISAEEVNLNYREGLVNYATDGLVGYWPFELNIFDWTSAIDQSGNGNDGIYHGNAYNGQYLRTFDGEVQIAIVDNVTITDIRNGSDVTAEFDRAQIPLAEGGYRILYWPKLSYYSEEPGSYPPGDHLRVRMEMDNDYGNFVRNMEFFISGSPYFSEWFNNGITGENTVSYGKGIGTGGDVNRDSYPDMLIGDPDFEFGRGKVFLYYGSPDRSEEAKSVFYGEQDTMDEFGRSAMIGNFNGDEYGDIVIGAPGYNDNEGRLFVYYGSKSIYGASAFDVENPNVVLTIPPGAGQIRMGEFIDIGDFNSDGKDDILVGAPSRIGGLGQVFVYNGGDLEGHFVELVGGGDLYAKAVAVLGDIDRDGFDDFAVGVPSASISGETAAGQVNIFFGDAEFFDTGRVHQVGAVLKAPNPLANDMFGYSIARGGDVNHDTYKDILVGKRTVGNTQEGRAWVFYGGVRAEVGNPYNTITLPQPKDLIDRDTILEEKPQQFGLTIASAGDLDGDDHDDIVIGAPDAGTNGQGAVYVYMGGEIIDWNFDGYNFNGYVINGRDEEAHLGTKLLNLGDYNADSYSEIAFNDVSGDVNVVRVFFNSYATDMTAPMITDATPFDEMVGVPVNPTCSFKIFDRGKSGLNLASLQLDFYLRGMKQNAIELIRKGGIVANQPGNTKFVWPNAVIESAKLTVHTPTTSVTYYDGENIPPYAQAGMVRGVDIEFKLFPEALKYSEGYVFEFSLRDWGPVPPQYQVLEFVGNVTSPNLMKFSTDQDILVDGLPQPAYGRECNRIKNIGDFNGDGIDDLAVYHVGDAGQSNGRLKDLEDHLDYRNWFVELPSDTTYYNVDEDAGYVLIYFGGPGIKLGTPNVVIIEPEQYSGGMNRFAEDVTGVGMLTKDLTKGGIYYSDLVIVDGSEGYIYRYPGQGLQQRERPTVIFRYDKRIYIGNNPGENPLSKVAGLGDVNNDEYPDFAVSDTGSRNVVYVLYGSEAEAIQTNYTTIIDTVDSGFGYDISRAGDVDGDGVNDIIVGAPYYDDVAAGKAEVGAVYCIKGLSLTPGDPKLIYELDDLAKGIRAYAHFGSSVAGGGYLGDRDIEEYGYDGTVTGGYPDIVVGAPDDNQFGPLAGSVTIFYGGPTPLGEDFNLAGAANRVLVPESINAHFGHKVAFSKFISSTAHYSKWSEGRIHYNANRIYFDDFDDVAVAAYGYQDRPTREDNRGKIFIYPGGPDMEDKAGAGFEGPLVGGKLGLYLETAGDLLNLGSEQLMALGEHGSSFKLLRNRDVPDTTPPVFTYMTPDNNSYDVPTDAAIVFQVADASGIDPNTLEVMRFRRDYTTNDRWVIIHGLPQAKSAEVPTSEYELLVQDVAGSGGTEKRFTIAVSDEYEPLPLEYRAGEWTESDPVNLFIMIGDARLVWTQDDKREQQSLYQELNYGFMTKFKPNEETKYEIFGQKTPNSYFGSSVAQVGDIDGDGMDDFVVGEYGNSERGVDAGKVHLFLGSGDPFQLAISDKEIDLGPGSGSSKFGYRVAPAGDMNGDGYADVAITGFNSGLSGGEVFILYGNPDPIGGLDGSIWDETYLNVEATVVQAEAPQDGFGAAIHGGGDINGDGFDDLVIGAPYKDISGMEEAGRAYVILGRQILKPEGLRNLNNPTALQGSHGPIRISDLEDISVVNLDGYEPTNLNETLYGFYINGSEEFERFGLVVLTGLNINGDLAVVNANNPANPSATKNSDVSEFIIGAPGWNDSRGKAYIYSYNKEGNTFALRELIGEEEGEQFGFAMVSMGDISNDDNGGENPENPVLSDFAISAPYNNNSGINSGIVQVYLGNTSLTNIAEPYLTLYGEKAGDLFGYALANVGNVDNDERNNNDLAVASVYNDKKGENGGRVYVFASALGEDDFKNLILVMDRFADFANEGNAGELFGFSIAGLGDIDGDFVPEYVVGAPSFSQNNDENIGKVFLFTNPDMLGPMINNAMTLPFPDSTGNIKLYSYWDTPNAVTVNEPLLIRVWIQDNRVVNVGGANIELKGEDENQAYTYRFDVPTNRAFYTLHNRKIVEFFLIHPYYRFDEWVDVTVNVTDMRGNLINSNFNLGELGGPYHYRFKVEPNPWGGPSRIICKVNAGAGMQHAGVGDSKQYTDSRFIQLSFGAIDPQGVSSINVGMGSVDIMQTAGGIPLNTWVDAWLYDDNYNPANPGMGTTPTFNLGLSESYASYTNSDYGLVELSEGDGIKTFAFQARDKLYDKDPSGNASEVVTVSVILDTGPPVVSKRVPARNSLGNADDTEISFRIADSGTGINLENLSVLLERGPDQFEYFVKYGTQPTVFGEFYEDFTNRTKVLTNFIIENNGGSYLIDTPNAQLELRNGAIARTGSEAYTDLSLKLVLKDFDPLWTFGTIGVRSRENNSIFMGYEVVLAKDVDNYKITLQRRKPDNAVVELGVKSFVAANLIKTEYPLKIIMNGGFIRVYWDEEVVITARDDTYIRGGIRFVTVPGPGLRGLNIGDVAVVRLPEIVVETDLSSVHNVHNNSFPDADPLIEFESGSLVGDISVADDPKDPTFVNKSLRLTEMPTSFNCFTSDSTLPDLGDDYVLEFDCLIDQGSDAYVYFRIQDNENGYVLRLGAGDLSWSKWVNGVQVSELGTQSYSGPFGEWKRYKLVVNGTRFQIFEGAEDIPFSDVIDSQGVPFITGGFGFGGTGINIIYIDDVSAGNILKNVVNAILQPPQFNYEDWVSVNIFVEDYTVEDYADHRITESYLFRVSPDYRAPVNPYLSINEGALRCTLNVDLSISATDDVGITEIYVAGDVTNSAALTGSLHGLPLITGETISVNEWIPAPINGLQKFAVAIDPAPEHAVGDRLINISVKFRDAQGNVSAIATDDIFLLYFTTGGKPVPTKFFINSTSYDSRPKYTSQNIVWLALDAFDVVGSGKVAAMKVLSTTTDGKHIIEDHDDDRYLTYKWVTFNNYAQTKLTDAEGTKNISAYFLDQDTLGIDATLVSISEVISEINAGNVTPGALGKESVIEKTFIILDTSIPNIINVQNVPGTLYKSYYYAREGGALEGRWSATDYWSDIDRYEYRIMTISEATVTYDSIEEYDYWNEDAVPTPQWETRTRPVTVEEVVVTSNPVTAWIAVPNDTVTINRFEDNAVQVFTDTQLSQSSDGYYFEVKAYDGAGNYAISTSNLLGVDLQQPDAPTLNYYENIKLNRPVFDIDFSDNLAGIYKVEISTSNPNARRTEIEDITNYSIISVGDYRRNYDKNWRLSEGTWQGIPSGQNTMYFKITDAAGNVSYPGINYNNFSFIKDIDPPQGNVRFNDGVGYTNDLDTTTNVNFSSASDFGLVCLTRYGVSINEFIEDYSFEDVGDAGGIPSDWHWKLDGLPGLNGLDRITMSVEIISDQAFTKGIQLPGKEGLYGLLVSFNVNPMNKLIYPISIDGFSPWEGLTREIAVTSGNVTYNVTGFINMSGFLTGQGGIGGLSIDGPYFQFKITGKYSVTQSVSVYSEPFWGQSSDWMMFHEDIYMPPNSTINISLVLSEVPTWNDTDFFRGYILLDGINAIPGGELLVTENSISEFPYKLLPGSDGSRQIHVLARDDVGNWVSDSQFITLDTTPPTWSGTHDNIFGATVTHGVWVESVSDDDDFQTVTNKLRAAWRSYDVGSGIDHYMYRVEKRIPTSDSSTWYPSYPIVPSTSNYKLTTQTEVDYILPLARNGAYRFVLRSVDKLGYVSEEAYSNEIRIDIDEPESTIVIQSTPIVTFNIPIADDTDDGLQDGFITQNSGWYIDGPIMISISATDISGPGPEDNFLVSGSGVTTINYITGYSRQTGEGEHDVMYYYSPTRTVTISTYNQVVSVSLNVEGQNIFGYWSQDRVGYAEDIRWVTRDLNIDRSPPTVSSNLHIYRYTDYEYLDGSTYDKSIYSGGEPGAYTRNGSGWFGSDDIIWELTVDDGLRAALYQYEDGRLLKHRYDRLGDGTSTLNWRVDDNPSGSMLLDARESGSRTPFGIPPTIDPSAIEGWSTSLNPYIEPYSVKYADGVLPPVTTEGIHKIYFWAEDKYGHVSTVNYVDDIRIDTGKPLLSVNLGGSFQTIWCTDPNGINATLEAMDVYAYELPLDKSWYHPLVKYPADVYVDGYMTARPGSGIKSLWYQINDRAPVIMGPSDPERRDRFGFTTTARIRDNGYNVIRYKVTDNALNFTRVFDGGISWWPELKSWIGDVDEGMIRFIRIDNLPPSAGVISLDKYEQPVEERIYTNSRLVSCNLRAQDNGIGVKYAYLDGYDLETPSSWNALENYDVPGKVLYNVNTWNNVLDDQDADLHWFDDGDAKKGPRALVEINRYIWLHDKDGTKNVRVVFADDFGRPFEQASANESLEKFDFDNIKLNDPALGQYPYFIDKERERLEGYIKKDVFRNITGQESETTEIWTKLIGDNFIGNVDASGDYGQVKETLPKDRASFESEDFMLASGVTLSASQKTRVYDILEEAITWPRRAVYTILADAIPNHTGATANTIIVLDRTVNTGSAVVTNLIQAGADSFVGTRDVALAITHYDPTELSGIRYMYVYGDPRYVENNGNNNKWVAFDPTTANRIVIRVTELNETKKILIKFKDRAGNIGGVTTVNVYYEAVMEYNNPQFRISFPNGAWYTDTQNIVVKLNFPGANTFHVTGDVAEPITMSNGIQYDTLVDFDLSAGDGLKNVGIWLEDRIASTDILDNPFLLDTTDPVCTDNIDTTDFYYDPGGAAVRLKFNDNPAGIPYVSGLKKYYYQINGGVVVAKDIVDTYGHYSAPDKWGVTVNIRKDGVNNEIKYWAQDMAGNISAPVEVGGIKINMTPPDVAGVVVVNGKIYNDEPGIYYVNSTTVTFDCYLINVNLMRADGDIALNDKLEHGVVGNPYKKVVTLTGGDGLKTVTLYFGDELSDSGGYWVERKIELKLDTTPPETPTIITPVNPLSTNTIPVLLQVLRTGSDAPSSTVLVTNLPTKLNGSVMSNISGDRSELLLLKDRTLIKLGVTYDFEIKAKDRAGNLSTPVVLKIYINQLGALNIMAGSLSVEVSDIAIASVNALHERFERANSAIQGVKANPLLDNTVREFNAVDAGGTTLHDDNIYAGCDMELVLPIPGNLSLDSKANPYDLRIYTLNEMTGQWELVPGEHRVDVENGTVSVAVPHLSYYRLFEIIPFATNLSSLKVYPNPYRPDDGDASTGDDISKFITFEGLTATSVIKIYTISGELVNTLDYGNPVVSWEADNFDGEKVASGIYIYLITDQDNNKKIGRITIIRGED
ncbi:LamG-like jellyroll fold domain-containing protein [Candidatus Margulisiibacteriota bacterium]